ncbi:MAG: STAS domain-containing protein [Anaerolineaceae bacterium]|nr:STAS domain-containing protein [Anaerolineaceae bacterium]
MTIDSDALTYISSAGLRVFLIMKKTLKDGEQFQITNLRGSVKKILYTTGFSNLFDCEG